MKTDDIFEAITDIDDRFIAEARPTDLTDDQTVIAYPAVKKPIWRTLVPAAACVMALAAAGAFGVKYFGGRGVQPSNSTVSSPASLNGFLYPEEAKYIVDKEITRFNFAYASSKFGNPSAYDDVADYAESYDELAAKSDLIVAGTFIDVIHQTQDFEEIFHSGDNCVSYNSLEVDKVLKGNVEEKDILTICQNSSISAGTDIVYNFFVGDQLSPMLKGDKWIYFLKKDENGIYSPVNGPQGRYPLPGYTNTFITCDGIVATVDKFGAHANAAPARDEIYDTLLRLLNLDLTEITVPSDSSRNDFQMEEFPNYEFAATHKGILVNSNDLNALDVSITSGDSVENLFLCDLNGDGKRELCATVLNDGVRSVEVIDLANNEIYASKGTKSVNEQIKLDSKGGVLYAVTSEIHSGAYEKEISRKALSLDILEKVTDSDKTYEEIPLYSDQTFTLPDFEGFEFNVDTSYEYPQFTFGWGSSSSSNHVNAVYLCDLDGDGKREIVMNCSFIGDGCIRVYGFKDNGEMGEALYFENGGCQLIVSDGKLNYKSQGSDARPFDFSKFDLKPLFTQMCQYELLDWDHDMHFNEIVPITGEYNIRISNRTLKINHKGKLMFDSGTRLGELYTIPDRESNSLIFVFTNEADGMVSALKISEKPAMLYRFEENVTLKSNTEELHIVYEDGREEPFVFPDSSTLLLQ